ncbi:MAG: hypothetical protein AB1393_13965 [Candidatus Edwardsbacteria bacterium]
MSSNKIANACSGALAGTLVGGLASLFLGPAALVAGSILGAFIGLSDKKQKEKTQQDKKSLSNTSFWYECHKQELSYAKKIIKRHRYEFALQTRDTVQKNMQNLKTISTERLKQVLKIRWLKQYQDGWKCCQMSGFLQMWLTQHGFNTHIVQNKKHAWLLVETENGWKAIESTSSPPSIINDQNQKHQQRFTSITKAVLYERAYAWWKQCKIDERIISSL